MRGLRALLRQERSSRSAHEAAPPEAAHQVKRAEPSQRRREGEILSLLPVRSRLPVLDARCAVFRHSSFGARSFTKTVSWRTPRVQKRVEIIKKQQKEMETLSLRYYIVISKRSDIYDIVLQTLYVFPLFFYTVVHASLHRRTAMLSATYYLFFSN